MLWLAAEGHPVHCVWRTSGSIGVAAPQTLGSALMPWWTEYTDMRLNEESQWFMTYKENEKFEMKHLQGAQHIGRPEK